MATGGTVRIHSDTGSLLRASNHPGERPAERANGVTTGRQLQVALLYGTMVFYTALEQGQGSPSPKATTEPLTWLTKN